jgi:hypothetical protein
VLVLLVLFVGIAGAFCVALPVFLKTWPLTLAALTLGFGFAGVTVVLAVKKELPGVRRKMGLCAHCGYNLTGNVSGVCPECGGAI